MQTIRIVLADDHSIFRKGVKAVIEEERDINVIGEAANGVEAVEKVRDLAPDILLIDIAMPKMNGIEAAQIIFKQFRATKTIVLSMHNNDEYILKSVESGAYGYLMKDTSKEEMIRAIRTVANGDKYFNGVVSSIIVDGYLNKTQKKPKEEGSEEGIKLSKKEKIIVKYIIEGLSSRQIADKEDLSVRTVDNHRANMMKKLNVKNAAELVKIAIEKKLF